MTHSKKQETASASAQFQYAKHMKLDTLSRLNQSVSTAKHEPITHSL
jgi:hypothetical protein